MVAVFGRRQATAVMPIGTDVDSSGVVRSLSLGGLQRDCTHRGPMRPRPRSRPTVSPTFNAKPTPLRGGGGKVDTMRGRTGITPHGRAESLDSPLRESLDVCRSEQSLGSPKNGSRLMVCSIATPDSQSPERPRIHGHGRDRLGTLEGVSRRMLENTQASLPACTRCPAVPTLM